MRLCTRPPLRSDQHGVGSVLSPRTGADGRQFIQVDLPEPDPGVGVGEYRAFAGGDDASRCRTQSGSGWCRAREPRQTRGPRIPASSVSSPTRLFIAARARTTSPESGTAPRPGNRAAAP